MKKNKILYVFMIIALTVCFCLSDFTVAASIPRLGIGGPSSGTVQVGGTITYPVNIYNSATSVNLKASDIRITGVTADISIQGSGNSSRTIVLSNIQGSVGAVGYISYVAGNVASNEKGGNKAFEGQTTSFTIVATPAPQPQPQPQPQQPQQPLPPSNPTTPGNNNSTPENTNPDNGGQENKPENKPEEKDTTAPTMTITSWSAESVEVGKIISFDIQYADDKELGEITLSEKDITCYGFKADIKISGEGAKRTVTFSNIRGNAGAINYVKVAGNTAKDKSGNVVKDGGKTVNFKLTNGTHSSFDDDWVENPNTGR